MTGVGGEYGGDVGDEVDGDDNDNDKVGALGVASRGVVTNGAMVASQKGMSKMSGFLVATRGVGMVVLSCVDWEQVVMVALVMFVSKSAHKKDLGAKRTN